jgi:hypothetical protein
MRRQVPVWVLLILRRMTFYDLTTPGHEQSTSFTDSLHKKRSAVPYDTLAQLPDPVKDNLPKHARKIYKEGFNSAGKRYSDPSKRPVRPRARSLA